MEAPGGRQQAQGCLGFPPASLGMGKLRQGVQDGHWGQCWLPAVPRSRVLFQSSELMVQLSPVCLMSAVKAGGGKVTDTSHLLQ